MSLGCDDGGDGDADTDGDGDGDADSDGDGDGDADGDVDTDADGDGDVDADGDTDGDGDTDADADTDADQDVSGAMVSGTVARIETTCEELAGDGIGTLCVFLSSSCGDPESIRFEVEIVGADLSFHENVVAFQIPDVAEGAWHLDGFLDDDSSGCDTGATHGDIVRWIADCPQVTVTDSEDVNGALLVLDGVWGL